MDIRDFNRFCKMVSQLIGISYWGNFAVGVKSDGTVLVAGNSKNVNCNDWNNIIAVSVSGEDFVIGLRADGRVVGTGYEFNRYTLSHGVSMWANIIEVSTGYGHAIGLRNNGTVVVAGHDTKDEWDVGKWGNIVAIGGNDEYTVGLKKDGNIIYTGYYGIYDYNLSTQLFNINNIIDIAVCDKRIVGLRFDGTVIAIDNGNNKDDQCNVSQWHNIIAVSTGESHIVGLRTDGTVVATGSNSYGQCDVTGWRYIAGIVARNNITIGVKFDGTLIVAGQANNPRISDNISKWRLFENIKTFISDREQMKIRLKEEAIQRERAYMYDVLRRRKLDPLLRARTTTQDELKDLHGLFKERRRQKLTAKLAWINDEIEKFHRENHI